MDASPVSIGQRLYDLAQQGNEKDLGDLLVQANSDDLAFICVSCSSQSFRLFDFYSNNLVFNIEWDYPSDCGCREWPF